MLDVVMVDGRFSRKNVVETSLVRARHLIGKLFPDFTPALHVETRSATGQLAAILGRDCGFIVLKERHWPFRPEPHTKLWALVMPESNWHARNYYRELAKLNDGVTDVKLITPQWLAKYG